MTDLTGKTGDDDKKGQGKKTAEGDKKKTGDATGEPGQGKDDGKKFSQEDLDRVAGETRQTARVKAVNDLLKEMDFENADALKDVVKEYRENKKEQMTEVEKLATEIEALKPLKDKAASLETRIGEYEGSISKHLDSLKADLSIPDHVTPLLEAMEPDQQLAYLADNRAAFTKSKKVPETNAGGKGSSKTKETDKEKSERLRQKYHITY